MAEQEKNCYLGIDGKKYGPLSEQEVRNLYAQKKINGDTKFARKGATELITVAQSGIITPQTAAEDDGLPPFPTESVKKSKLGYIAAGLGVAVLVAIAFMVGVFINIGNNRSVTANSDAAQEKASEKLTVTPDEEKTGETAPENDGETAGEATPENNGALDFSSLEFATFRIPYSDVEFDYPATFTYKRTDKDDTDNFLITYMFEEPGRSSEDVGAFIFLAFNRPVRLDSNNNLVAREFSDFDIVSLETMIDTAKDYIAVRYEATFEELLRTFESASDVGLYYQFNSSKGRYMNADYYNYAFSDDSGNLRTIAMTVFVPADYVDDYEKFFDRIIFSLRSADTPMSEAEQSAKLSWEEALELIPSQYKEIELEYHPVYNYVDGDGVLFYSFYYYSYDNYGDILVNSVTGEYIIDSRELPDSVLPAEPAQPYVEDIPAESAQDGSSTEPPATQAKPYNPYEEHELFLRIDKILDRVYDRFDGDDREQLNFYDYAEASLLYFEGAELGYPHYFESGIQYVITALMCANNWAYEWQTTYDPQIIKNYLARIPAEARTKVKEHPAIQNHPRFSEWFLD